MSKEISIPDDLYDEMEALRAKLGMTSAEYFDEAAMLIKAKHLDDITDQINKICETEDTSIDPVIQQLQAKAIEREKW